MKKCSKCKVEKPLVAFSKYRSSPDGLNYWCKTCWKTYKQENKVCIAAWKKDWSQTSVGKEVNSRASVVQREKYPKRGKARIAVGHAIATGKLERPSICESCCDKRFVEAHHPNYDEPLEIEWLCKKCHLELHKELLLV